MKASLDGLKVEMEKRMKHASENKLTWIVLLGYVMVCGLLLSAAISG